MNAEKQTLILRADATAAIGTGHLMRCLALAQAWQDRNGRVVFVTCCESHALRERLFREGFSVTDIPETYPTPRDLEITLETLQSYPEAWLVLDGYHFDQHYQRRIKAVGQKLLVIDDMAHLEHYYADIVLNQNAHAEQLRYQSEPYTWFLLGPKYVLLRREFNAWRGYHRNIPDVAKRILVTMGGSDVQNVTVKVLEALSLLKVPGLEAKVIVGAANPHRHTIEEIARTSNIPVEVMINPNNMPEQMAWADLAITAGGTTLYELLFMGVPCLAFIIADNQVANVKVLDQMGLVNRCRKKAPSDIAETLLTLLKSPSSQQEMICRGQSLVDGEGPDRIITALLGLRLRLRLVKQEDAFLLWEWVNEPQVRRASFSSEPISWEEHKAWFQEKLSNANCLMFIALDNNDKPIGQIRFDIQGDKADISLSIAREHRGQGYATCLINTGVQELFDKNQAQSVNAYVKLNNDASNKAFCSAGFTKIGSVTVKKQVATLYTKSRLN